MSGFTIGINAPTIGIAISIIILISLLIGVFFLRKQADNKKSNETTTWNSTNYETLRNKINLIMKSEGIIEKFASFSAPNQPLQSITLADEFVPSLLDCVSNRLTLEYDAKIIDNSSFNSIVKKLIQDCKYAMEKQKTDPSIPDPDPGPPVWTDKVSKNIKEQVSMSLNYGKIGDKMLVSDKQVDCVVTKIKTNFNNPRDLKKIQEKEGFILMKKFAADCGINWNPPSGPIIVWDDENLKKLKTKIISLSDSSISSASQSFFDCVTSKIITSSEVMMDQTLLDDDTRFKPFVNKIIKDCQSQSQSGTDPIIRGGWTKETLDQIKNDMKNTIFQTMGKYPADEELRCVVNKITEIFKSPTDILSLDKENGNQLMEKIINECITLWTPEVYKQFKDNISTKLSELGAKPIEAELNCIVDQIKRLYKNPNNIPDMYNVVKGIYPICTNGRILK